MSTANTTLFVALALGGLGLHYITTKIYMSKVERAVDSALDHVGVQRSLVNYRDLILETELRKLARPPDPRLLIRDT